MAAGDTTSTRRGVRRVELFFPITPPGGGAPIDVIEIAPCKLDVEIRWAEGKIAGGTLALLSELTGLNEATIRELASPDSERVLKEFLASLPASLDIGTQPSLVPPVADAPEPAFVRPDLPIPPLDEGTGFDMGEGETH